MALEKVVEGTRALTSHVSLEYPVKIQGMALVVDNARQDILVGKLFTKLINHRLLTQQLYFREFKQYPWV